MIERLSEQQTAEIYRSHLVFDFPPNEVKPLDRIRKAMAAGRYHCFGLFEKHELAGYAFFVDHRGYFLLDYLAIVRGKRDQGFGSRFLNGLSEQFQNTKGVMIEVENPEFAANKEERELRLRRIQFYLRNGCTDTGVDVSAFGVPFRLLEITRCGLHSADELRVLYRALYGEILPPELLKMVRV